MNAFLGRPTRGGKLTIVNCLLWVIAALALATQQTVLATSLVLVCWWPMAWLFIMPTMGGRRPAEFVVAVVAVGVNSLLWGYGISWLLSLVHGERRARRSGGAGGGFEVVTPAE